MNSKDSTDSNQNWIFKVAQKFSQRVWAIVHGLWPNFTKNG